MKINIEKIKELVNIGLKYNVEYVYILEDIDKLLKGIDIKINIENYLDN